MRVKCLALDNKADIRVLFIIDHCRYSSGQSVLAVVFEIPVWTWIRIQLVNIFQVILSIASANNIKLRSNKCHRMTCPHLRLLLKVCETVAVSPFRAYWVKGIKIIEALGMWT